MTYVDALIARGWRLGPSSHLIADSEAELRAFARRLGLRPAWLQRDRHCVPHFDLTAARRARAVALGAVELDRAAFVRKCQALRERAASARLAPEHPAAERTLSEDAGL